MVTINTFISPHNYLHTAHDANIDIISAVYYNYTMHILHNYTYSCTFIVSRNSRHDIIATPPPLSIAELCEPKITPPVHTTKKASEAVY